MGLVESFSRSSPQVFRDVLQVWTQDRTIRGMPPGRPRRTGALYCACVINTDHNSIINQFFRAFGFLIDCEFSRRFLSTIPQSLNRWTQDRILQISSILMLMHLNKFTLFPRHGGRGGAGRGCRILAQTSPLCRGEEEFRGKHPLIYIYHKSYRSTP